ncbi:MAG: hypothetical protein QG621_614, partial [Patescibacteria group bacterium]|nr:hypothetical protein [Patescibacteria group bacterium]
MHLRRRWNILWGHQHLERVTFGGYETLAQLYGGRPYFHLGYVAELLNILDDTKGQIFLVRHTSFGDVEKALWFHELFRNPKRQDNEEQSAQCASMLMRLMNRPVPEIVRVKSLILAAKQKRLQFEPDHQLLHDLTLVKFAQAADEYDDMANSIRKENKYLLDIHYAGRRLYDLETLMRREYLYHLPIFRKRYEAQARANIVREM